MERSHKGPNKEKRMRKALLTIGVVLALAAVAGACGTNAHPWVTDEGIGTGGGTCTVRSYHTSENASMQTAVSEFTDDPDTWDCEQPTEVCVQWYEIAGGGNSLQCKELWQTDFDRHSVQFSRDSDDWTILDVTVTINPNGANGAFSCDYHDANNSNTAPCHNGIPV